MKKIFFNIWLLLALGTVTVVFNSCSKNDDSKQDSLTVDKGVVINRVKWATCNVDKPGTFAAKPEDVGMLYQWNRKIGWSATDPMISSNGSTIWDATVPEGTEWTKANDPSPAGWRVPTLDEIQSLLDTGEVRNEWTTQNGINGRKFTDRTSGNSIFLPAVYHRNFSDGTFDGTLGGYWSSTQRDSGIADALYFSSGDAHWSDAYSSFGFSVRSVAN